MEITRLDPALKQKAADVTARAFFNYPMMQFYFPNLPRRERHLAWYMGRIQECGLRFGDVYAAQNLAGTACFLPPEHSRISTWEYIQAGILQAPFKWGLKDYRRVLECEEVVEQMHDQVMQGRPHFYLWWLAVDPPRQHQGMGSALMVPGFEKADRQKQPVYLETHAEQNVAFYQKRGFTLARAAEVEKYHLPFWCMVREPQG
jgi:GNAT superfamily N-acetyltransferase